MFLPLVDYTTKMKGGKQILPPFEPSFSLLKTSVLSKGARRRGNAGAKPRKPATTSGDRVRAQERAKRATSQPAGWRLAERWPQPARSAEQA